MVPSVTCTRTISPRHVAQKACAQTPGAHARRSRPRTSERHTPHVDVATAGARARASASFRKRTSTASSGPYDVGTPRHPTRDPSPSPSASASPSSRGSSPRHPRARGGARRSSPPGHHVSSTARSRSHSTRAKITTSPDISAHRAPSARAASSRCARDSHDDVSANAGPTREGYPSGKTTESRTGGREVTTGGGESEEAPGTKTRTGTPSVASVSFSATSRSKRSRPPPATASASAASSGPSEGGSSPARRAASLAATAAAGPLRSSPKMAASAMISSSCSARSRRRSASSSTPSPSSFQRAGNWRRSARSSASSQGVSDALALAALISVPTACTRGSSRGTLRRSRSLLRAGIRRFGLASDPVSQHHDAEVRQHSRHETRARVRGDEHGVRAVRKPAKDLRGEVKGWRCRLSPERSTRTGERAERASGCVRVGSSGHAQGVRARRRE